MIGYYVHHHGQGHLNRARSLNAELGPLAGLSSLPRPAGWIGAWVDLPRDDEGPEPTDVTAGGLLHFVPEHDPGLRARMHEIASWIDDIEPELMIVDVSVEVTLLARLHGVPVVSMVLPGDRRDPAHVLGHSVSRALVGPWPAAAHGVVRLDQHVEDKLETVGGISRFDDRVAPPRSGSGRHDVLMLGAGGHQVHREDVDSAKSSTPGWTWTELGPDAWVEDPWEALCAADVVVTHAGQNAIAEVAAARRPAIVLPQDRPFGEQDALAAALAVSHEWPAVVRSDMPRQGWAELLEQAAALDGERWSTWNDGKGAARAADVVRRELERGR